MTQVSPFCEPYRTEAMVSGSLWDMPVFCCIWFLWAVKKNARRGPLGSLEFSICSAFTTWFIFEGCEVGVGAVVNGSALWSEQSWSRHCLSCWVWPLQTCTQPPSDFTALNRSREMMSRAVLISGLKILRAFTEGNLSIWWWAVAVQEGGEACVLEAWGSSPPGTVVWCLS